MRNALLAGASAFALVLGGCSLFPSGDHSAKNTGSHQTPALSGSSQAPMQAQNQQPPTQNDAAPDQTGSPGKSTAKHGSRSRMSPDEVKQAQQKLVDDGDYKGKVDGKFGSQTAQAVKQYQQKNGLKQTGRLDHDTLGKLGVGTAGSGSSAAPAGTPSSGTSMPATKAPD